MTTPRPTFFIAYAGADKARARRLRDLPHPEVSTLLDVVDLPPRVAPRAERARMPAQAARTLAPGRL